MMLMTMVWSLILKFQEDVVVPDIDVDDDYDDSDKEFNGMRFHCISKNYEESVIIVITQVNIEGLHTVFVIKDTKHQKKFL